MKSLKFTTEKEYDGYIRVNSCGQQWLTDRDYNTLRENGRVDYSVHYVAKGKGYYEYEGKNYVIPEGSLVLFFPKVRTHYYFKKEDGTEMRWAHFSGNICQNLEPLNQDLPLLISIKDKKQFESAFEKMIRSYYAKREGGNMLCDGYMQVILGLILQSAKNEDNKKKPYGNEALEKVLSIMHVEFDKPIDVGRYASICHLSEDRFIRMFKSYTGIPPYRYQLKIRVERAVEMLENHSLSVAECAYMAGFTDAAYFSRIFKKFTGHPPSYYKK